MLDIEQTARCRGHQLEMCHAGWCGNYRDFVKQRKSGAKNVRPMANKYLVRAGGLHRLFVFVTWSYGMALDLDAKLLGKQFAEFRASAQMSQHKLAQEAGLSQAFISAFESGNSPNISVSSFLKIAKKLKLGNIVVPETYVPTVVNFLLKIQQREKDSYMQRDYGSSP